MCLGRSFSLAIFPQQFYYITRLAFFWIDDCNFFIPFYNTTSNNKILNFCVFIFATSERGGDGRQTAELQHCTARANFPFLAARCSLLLVQPYGWWWWWCGVPLVAAITRAVYAQCPPICYAASPAFYTQSIPAQIRCPHCLVSDRYRPFPLHPGYGGKGLPNPLHTQEGAIAG